ncbi:hypothetical protein E2C01_026658 [Portunus trituberculatus]|uniref:Uncharacterized protein n=1 Tax=Portunus trituberculatus TaxID=210409 RepID=A0A5B7ELK7_PORTR|nr:hypothetical protein [Portunus trituberculatus]
MANLPAVYVTDYDLDPNQKEPYWDSFYIFTVGRVSGCAGAARWRGSAESDPQAALTNTCKSSPIETLLTPQPVTSMASENSRGEGAECLRIDM